jgi:hypothetical protein
MNNEYVKPYGNYYPLNSAYKFNYESKNELVYSGIHGGANCLYPRLTRSTFDMYKLEDKKWPIAVNTDQYNLMVKKLGWK